MPTILSFDYETFSEQQLSGPQSVGVWNYTRDISTEALMVAYRFDGGDVQHVDLTQDDFPAELEEALLDPHVEKWAFNAAFERMVTRNVLRIDTPYTGWRCTMALANLQSFSGDLFQIGKAMGLDEELLKDKEGSRLIQMFCMPQKVTRKSSAYRRDMRTNPDEWLDFCGYNIQDVIAEDEIKTKLFKFPIPDEEWQLYELDQQINDRGLPVNRRFVEWAHQFSVRRKAELTVKLSDLTGLKNPNSGPQMLPWLRERGYPFSDLQKNTVKKVLTEHEEAPLLTLECVKALKLRQQASRTSVKKYPAILRRLAVDDRLRHCFQFAGAARTARWAGRGPQPHNLTKTPAVLEAEDGDASKLEAVAKMIEAGDYDNLDLMMAEPMSALAGSVRSSFQSPDGQVFVVSDLSAIESAVSAWLFGCKRLLRVFRDGLDPYRDFGVELFKIAYDEISKAQRTICKPAVLGCTYQLGGGDLREGKRTGLWGYAENMGVNITREDAHRQVALYREIYSEIPDGWKTLEAAAKNTLGGWEGYVCEGKLHFGTDGPYLKITLPSGRPMRYYKPRIVEREFQGKEGPYTRKVFSYMGMNQVTRIWGRVYSSGGKLMENVVQATARDVLALGKRRADIAGFPIVGSVHDEIITLVRRGDNRLTLSLLEQCMKQAISWAPGLPLGAAGYEATVYRKD